MFEIAAALWYSETLYPQWQQQLAVETVLFEEQTEQQHLVVFENPTFGRVLALDGVVQLTERDEFVYHEMMTHVPLLAHGNARSVLVIGGGDGGILREVLRHPVERVVLVEIDGAVVDFAKRYFPMVSNGAFDDPRLEVRIEDGAQYVRECGKAFDVILCDSTDPHGPGAVLFTPEFYRDCAGCLTDGGIFVNQSGVPFLQGEELAMIHGNLREAFQDVRFYLGVIPTYVGGFMAFGYATQGRDEVGLAELKGRMEQWGGACRYYAPEVHQAAFALPPFIRAWCESAR